MDRESMMARIICRVVRLDREQLEQLARLLDQLQGHPENPQPAAAPDPAKTESD